LLATPDSKETSCADGFPDPSKTEWASHAGRGSDSTTCVFAKNVLDAYWRMGTPDPALRKVSAPGTVSCTDVAPGNCDPNSPDNFLMECQSKESPDWITCVGGRDAKVYLY
jgi:hypothetical protein